MANENKFRENKPYLKWRIGILEKDLAAEKGKKNYNVKYDMYYHGDKSLFKVTPIRIKLGTILKICITIIFLMCIISVNGTDTSALPNTNNIKFDSTNVIQNYNLQNVDIFKNKSINYGSINGSYTFKEDETIITGRIINVARCFEVFGNNTTWTQIWSIWGSEENGILPTIQKIIVAPFNLVLNVLTLGTNLINTMAGSEKVIEPKPIEQIIWDISQNIASPIKQGGWSIGNALAELWKSITS